MSTGISTRMWLAIVLMTLPAQRGFAQVPERVRVDMGIGYVATPDSPSSFLGPGSSSASVSLFDLSVTVNVSPRVMVSAGIPLVVTIAPQTAFAEPRIDGGVGDAHAEVGVVVLGERQYAPGLSLAGETGSPTATGLAFLGTGLWRATGAATLSKSLHPRLSLSVDGGYSHFVEQQGIRVERIHSVGAGLAVGVTRASLLNLHVGQMEGGARREGRRLVQRSVRDLQASVGITRYSKGRPRVSFLVSAVGLRHDPKFVFGLRWAVMSR